ncbi:hypothetical protein V8B97DRAFT_1918706 [Scleroderma yunnanense]
MATADLLNTLGNIIDELQSAEFIGGMVSTTLYGITTLQTYLYFMNYPDDGVGVKLCVMIVWVLDTLHVSLKYDCSWVTLAPISDYGIVSTLGDSVWSLFASVAVNLCIACVVQADEDQVCHRRLRWLVTIPIIVAVLVHLGRFWHRSTKGRFNLSSFSQLALYSVAPSAAIVISDVLITIALCVLLRKYISHVVSSRIRRLINTLVIYAINRCLLTSLAAIAEVTVWSVDPNSSWYTAIDFTIGKLYTNSLLASLNSRNYLHNQESGEGAETNVNVTMSSVLLEAAATILTMISKTILKVGGTGLRTDETENVAATKETTTYLLTSDIYKQELLAVVFTSIMQCLWLYMSGCTANRDNTKAMERENLYGLTTLQTYLYFMNYPDDGAAVKIFVMIICNELALANGVWYVEAPSLSEHYCFLSRAEKLEVLTQLLSVGFNGSEYVYCMFGSGILHSQDILSLSSPSEMAGDRAYHDSNTSSSWFWHRFTETSSSLSQFMPSAAILGALVVISDVLITIALCVLLRNYSSHIISSRMKRLIHTLITYAIERCLLTSLVVIVGVIVGLIDINSWWYLAIDFTTRRLYTNSLLASLNTRNYLRNHESGEVAELNVDTIQFVNLPNLSRPNELDTPGGDDHKFGPRSQDDLDSTARQEDV